MTDSAVRPRRDAVANREALLEAARRTFARDPYASIDAIARAAGLSRRAVYGHFADRDALIGELIRTGADRFNAIAASVQDDVDAATALARLTSRLWTEAAQVQVAASLALDESHVAATAAALAPLRQRVRALVERGQRSGALRGDMAPDMLARLVEEVARTAVVRLDADEPDARELAVKVVLGVAGLSWRDATTLLAAAEEGQA